MSIRCCYQIFFSSLSPSDTFWPIYSAHHLLHLSICLAMASIAMIRRSAMPPMRLAPIVRVAHRSFLSQSAPLAAPNSFIPGNISPQPSYFQRPSLPANTIIRFVPQQTAWIVERMGKFNRILQPGLAILIPLLDRIAYVRSLKEVALEIPSQSAITADNVTLELDGVLYTRVVDAYKARSVTYPISSCRCPSFNNLQLWCGRC
jgi:hypothetical protein